jgi:hypothetical protein
MKINRLLIPAYFLLCAAVAHGAQGTVNSITGGDAGQGFTPLPIEVAAVDLGGGPTLTIQGVTFSAGDGNLVGEGSGAYIGDYNYGQTAAGYGFGNTANDTSMAAMLTGFTWSANGPWNGTAGGPNAQYQFTGLTVGQTYQVDVFTVADANPRDTFIQVIGTTTLTNNVLTGLAPQDVVYTVTPNASGDITVNFGWGGAAGGSGTSGLVSGIALTTATLSPQVIVPSLNTNEVIVAMATPQMFGAHGDGITDDSGPFQNAMNAVANAGGGVVYAPAGNYAFYTNLTIPTGVTLQGNWKDWTTGTNGCVGTTFKVYFGAGQITNASYTAFINVTTSATLKDVNIWYPNQNPNSITPYPYTLQASGGENIVQNVVLVNSYQGISAIFTAHYHLTTVIGTPLFIGFLGDQCYDVCHTEDIRFNPNVWAASKLTNAPAVGGSYATWMKTNGTAMEVFSIAGFHSIDTAISGYNIGILHSQDGYGTGGSCWYEGWVTNCATAVQMAAGIAQFGWFTLEGNVAINHNSATNDATVALSHCTVMSTSSTAVNCAGQTYNTEMQFQTCTISNTMQLSGPGVLNLVDCSLSGSTQCVMSASATKAGFTGCTFSPSQKIVNNAGATNLLVNSGQSISNAFPMVSWTNIVSSNLCRPAKTNLYNAMSYGATGNGTNDDTAAIQAALTAAGNNGGGIVYLPAGFYYTSTSLTVPSGVRLQGTDEGMTPQYGGAMIEVHAGQGTTNGPPAIVLDANSGLWGVNILYPNQNTNSYLYPPTIQGRGANVYVIGVFCPNAYIYIDFDSYTCTNHFVDYNYGYALYQECLVGNGSSGSLVNNQFHGIFTEFSDSQPLNINFVLDNLALYALGNCSETIGNCFTYGTHNYLYTFAEGGKGPNATLINAAQDGSSGGYVFNSAAASTINIINQTAAIWGQADISEAAATVIASTTNFQGTARIFNGEDWSCGNVVNLNGGDVGLEMYDQMAGNTPDFFINAGVFHLINLYQNGGYYAPGPQVIIFGISAGLPGKTNEFIGSYSVGGFNCIFNNVTNHYNIWNNYSLTSSNVFNLGPVVVGDFYPNGAYQFQATSALTFQAYSTNGINASGITVQLSGTNLLGQSYVSNYTSANGLIIGGSSTFRTISAPLSANAVYSAVTVVTDASGNVASNNLPYFDTINPANYTFEAEDFDYNGGDYINNPQTNAYAGLSGVAGIDYSNSLIGTGSASYRPQGLETEGDSDILRLAYSGVLQDYDVGYNYGGDGNWGNYTRLFPAGTYYIFMRSANGPASDSESMYQVTAGRGTANQTLSLLGTFSAVNTGGWQTYAWVPLLNSSGGLATFTGGSVETLRVTTVNGGNNINCYMLVPTNAMGASAIPITGGNAGHGFAPLPVDVAGVDLGGGPTLTIQGVTFTSGSATSVGGASLGTYNYGQTAAGYGFGTTANDTNMAAMLTGFTYSSTPQESTIGGNAYAQYQFTGLNVNQSYQVDVFTVADANPRYTLIQAVGGITLANNVLTGLAPQDMVYTLTPDASGHITVQWAWGTGAWVTNSNGTSGLVSGIAVTTSSGNEPQLIQAPPTSTMPALSLRPTAGTQGLTLQWPENNDTKISGAASQPNLYYTPSLVAPAVWMLVTNAPVLSNGQWMVTLPIGTNSSGYYRLQ